MITLPILFGQIAKPRTPPTWSVAVLMISRPWTFSLLVWSGVWDAGAPDTPTVHMFRVLIIAIDLAALMIFIGFSIYSLRKLLRRPHPFVEVFS